MRVCFLANDERTRSIGAVAVFDTERMSARAHVWQAQEVLLDDCWRRTRRRRSGTIRTASTLTNRLTSFAAATSWRSVRATGLRRPIRGRPAKGVDDRRGGDRFPGAAPGAAGGTGPSASTAISTAGAGGSSTPRLSLRHCASVRVPAGGPGLRNTKTASTALATMAADPPDKRPVGVAVRPTTPPPPPHGRLRLLGRRNAS